MPRPSGRRNPDYDERRAELIERLERRLIAPPDHPGMNELARAAGVSIPTMKHYFGDRAGVVAAVLSDGGVRGARFMAAAAEPEGKFEDSLQTLAAFILTGWRKGRLGSLHAVGFAEAQRAPGAAALYLDAILEPMIDAIAARLDAHVAAGEMRGGDTRHAAISFAGPLFLALLHQVEFAGGERRPIDLDRLAADHAEAFARAYRS